MIVHYCLVAHTRNLSLEYRGRFGRLHTIAEVIRLYIFSDFLLIGYFWVCRRSSLKIEESSHHRWLWFFFSSHFSRWSLCEILLLDCMLPQLRVFHASNSHGNSPGNVLFVHLHIYISLCRLPASHIVIALIYRSNIFEASVSHSRSPLRRILRWNEFHLCCCNYFKLSAAQHSKWAWGRAPNEKEIFQHLLFS